MQKFPKPWFRKGRGWFVQLGGKQLKLGDDKDEAFRQYHEIMARGVPKEAPTSGPSILEIFDRFITFCAAEKAEETTTWYKKHLKSFLDFLGADRHLPIAELAPHHVTDWLLKHPTWAPSTKRGRTICVLRAINWAVKGRRIPSNPLTGMEKPSAERRENVVSPEFFAQLISHVGYQQGSDLLQVAWMTGARPQEIFRVEARHLQGDRWVFPKEESKGRKRARIVLLTPEARAICERLAERWPLGPIFRNQDGKPFNPFAVNCLMCRLAKKTGRKVALYDLRHGYATRMLKAGNDTITVGALMGHSPGSNILSMHYAHIHQDQEHLKAALRKGV